MKENVIKFIRIIFVIILIYSIIKILLWLFRTENDKKQMAKLEEEVLYSEDIYISEDILLSEEIFTTVENKETTEESTLKTIDFEKLYAINSDVKGWIKMEKLDISYPIVQSYDNNYYLRKDIYKNKNISGSIFLDCRNNAFNDKHTIVYGHNMKNNTMFGGLKKIKDEGFGNDILISVETETKTYVYVVFSIYEISPQDFNIKDDVQTMLNRSIRNFGKKVSNTDKVLTLYTCTDSSTRRTILHAYLMGEIDL